MKRLATVLVVIAVLVPGAIWATEFLAVDKCLDAGAVFDYGTGQCDYSSLHLPYISFSARHRSLLLASGALCVLGLGLFMFGKGRAAVA